MGTRPFSIELPANVSSVNNISRKSCGIGQIPDVALKKAGNLVPLFLMILLNNCLNLVYFTAASKKVNMVLIPKRGSDPSKAYFPLSPFGMFLESLILVLSFLTIVFNHCLNLGFLLLLRMR